MILVTDIETDSLIDHKTKKFPSVIWIATTLDLDTKKMRHFSSVLEVCEKYGFEFIDKYWQYLAEADKIVGHNFIKYDREVIAKHTGYKVPLDRVEDTYVYSTLLDPKRPGGHSLGELAKIFGMEKPDHEDWTQFSPEMLNRNIEDVKINAKLYRHLISQFRNLGFSDDSYRVERNMAAIIHAQVSFGFPLRVEYARKIYYELKDQADAIEHELVKTYPPAEDERKGEWTHYKPRYNKDGTLNKTCLKILEKLGLPEDTPEFIHKPMRPFDPNSTKDRVRLLLSLGWQPFEFTETGQPKITDESLESFHDPAGKKLKDYIILRNREKVFYRWLAEVDDEGFVHSDINSIGTWTHRCSHTNFFGNPPRVNTIKFKTIEQYDSNTKTILEEKYTRDFVERTIKEKGECEPVLIGLDGGYGYESRATWGVPKDGNIVQVGTDASGIQMRAFAHYIEDDEYTRQVISSDIHTYNQKLAGLKSRASAKTFIYAFLLGSGDHKTGVIYDASNDELANLETEIMSDANTSMRARLDFGLEALSIPKTPRNYAIAYKGRQVKDQFIESIPGLQRIRKSAKVGWFRALDGRQIYIPSKHLYLACLLQSFEVCIMKRACIDYHKELTKRKIWFRQVNFIHDEFQKLTYRENAELVGSTVVNCIRTAGEIYGSLCPLDGEYKIGYSWADSH